MGRSSDAKERLLEAAIDLIYGRSFGAASVQAICTGAGVQKGSFYHFFPSKRDLGLAAIDILAERLREHVLDPAFAEDIPPLARLERFFELAADFQRRQHEQLGCVLGCPFGNLALEMSTQDEVLRQRIDGLFHTLERRIERTLEAAKADGSAPHVEPPSAARAIFALLEGALMVAKTRNDPNPISAMGRGAVAIALDTRSRSAQAG
jgi:TetR/AcrR family transcriptional repressor of nem operon